MHGRTGSAERALERAAALARRGCDSATFAERLVDIVQPVIPHAAACVVILDPATGLLTGTYKFGALADAHGTDREWARLEYETDDPTRMSVIASHDVPAAATSQLSAGPQGSVRFRELIGPAGYGDELRMVARHAGRSWGGVNLFRSAEERSFTDDEVLALAALSEAVADGLRRGLMTRCAAVAGTERARGPAILVLGPDARLDRIGVGTHELLRELTDEAHRSPVESLIHALVAAARRYANGDLPVLPHVRLRSRSGRWLVAHAAPLTNAGGPTGEVVITIDEARPPEIVPLLASAFGLTVRELEVTQLVLGGTDTKGIAAALSMSAYTVQDHLKSIFDKADVRSRRELVARVFYDQYVPRFGDEVGASGWFR